METNNTQSKRLTRGAFLTGLVLSLTSAIGILQGCGGGGGDPDLFSVNEGSLSATLQDSGPCPVNAGSITLTNLTGDVVTVTSGVLPDGVTLDKTSITLNPKGVADHSDSATVKVSVDCTKNYGLPSFDFSARRSDSSIFRKTVRLNVVDERSNITALPASITATHTIGTSPCPQTLGTFVVKNTGAQSMDVTIAPVTDLTISPASFTLGIGASKTVTVQFTCDDVPPLTKTITVNAVSPFLNLVTKTVSVQLNKG